MLIATPPRSRGAILERAPRLVGDAPHGADHHGSVPQQGVRVFAAASWTARSSRRSSSVHRRQESTRQPGGQRRVALLHARWLNGAGSAACRATATSPAWRGASGGFRSRYARCGGRRTGDGRRFPTCKAPPAHAALTAGPGCPCERALGLRCVVDSKPAPRRRGRCSVRTMLPCVRPSAAGDGRTLPRRVRFLSNADCSAPRTRLRRRSPPRRRPAAATAFAPSCAPRRRRRPPAHDSGPSWSAAPSTCDSCIRFHPPVSRRAENVSPRFPPLQR